MLLLLALGLLVGVSFVQQSLNRDRDRLDLTRVQHLENAPPVLAFTTMAWAQKHTTATRSALIFALEPVVAWITSWILTGETLSLRARLGAGLILGGVLLVEFRPETKRRAGTSQN